MELTADNIRVNTVLPGIIRTPMVDEPDADRIAAMIEAIPVKRMGSPAEVSNLIVYLASDDSSYSTGSEFVVDGGILA
jgi:3alpha(or 20beta)-hydroxysteroid dehydrogenase